MNHESLRIRMAVTEDTDALLAIYAPYVANTAITFEYTVPDSDEFKQRIVRTLEKYPYLIAERNGTILGYAYASAFKGRAAYDWAVETSIYVDQNCQNQGIGRQLYAVLEQTLKKQNILNSYACIAYPNPGSIRFHEQLGYQTIGHFTKCGYKLGKWYDMIWMEKMLGEHSPRPAAFIPITQIC